MLSIIIAIVTYVIIPVVIFVIGHFLVLKKTINLRRREHLQKDIYEPLYTNLLSLKSSLQHCIDSSSYKFFTEFQEHGNINECCRKIEKTYPSFLESLKYIYEKSNNYLNKFREILREHNKVYCNEKEKAISWSEPIQFGWYEIINLDLKKMSVTNKFIQIRIPQSKKVKKYYNYNLYKEYLETDWEEYFEKLKESLLKTPEIKEFLEKLKICTDYIEKMLQEAKKRKSEPLTLLEYYYQ